MEEKMQNQVHGYRLSPQQKQVWMLMDGSRLYRSVSNISISGELNIDLLQEAIRRVLERHEILRTNYYRRPGMKYPIQVIRENGEVACNRLDLSGWSREQQQEKIEELFNEKMEIGFDLE